MPATQPAGRRRYIRRRDYTRSRTIHHRLGVSRESTEEPMLLIVVSEVSRANRRRARCPSYSTRDAGAMICSVAPASCRLSRGRLAPGSTAHKSTDTRTPDSPASGRSRNLLLNLMDAPALRPRERKKITSRVLVRQGYRGLEGVEDAGTPRRRRSPTAVMKHPMIPKAGKMPATQPAGRRRYDLQCSAGILPAVSGRHLPAEAFGEGGSRPRFSTDLGISALNL